MVADKILFFLLFASLVLCTEGVTDFGGSSDPTSNYVPRTTYKRIESHTTAPSGIGGFVYSFFGNVYVETVLTLLFYASILITYVNFIWLCCISRSSKNKNVTKNNGLENVHGLSNEILKV